jgi:hypothetical protein
VLQGLDDSFEWFGGAVNSKYLISYESADDHFDASEGYIGRNQFLIAFQSIRPEPRPGLAGGVASDPQMIENDGCWAENCSAGDNNRSASQPYTVPVFANFTLVGAPQGAWETTGGNYGMMLRRGTGGLYVNGVVTRTPARRSACAVPRPWRAMTRATCASATCTSRRRRVRSRRRT